LFFGLKAELIGGQEPTGLNGFFFNPTIIANANLDMDLARDELFCPVLSLFSFETEEQAYQTFSIACPHPW
jgi:acyl-CoA reductase-like NAD-dependent aldehyde dehydrogenase